MTLRASYAGITLLALLGSDVVASAADDNKREPNIKTAGQSNFCLLREQLSVVVGQMGRQRH